jgi:hypothetical protein
MNVYAFPGVHFEMPRNDYTDGVPQYIQMQDGRRVRFLFEPDVLDAVPWDSLPRVLVDTAPLARGTFLMWVAYAKYLLAVWRNEGHPLVISFPRWDVALKAQGHLNPRIVVAPED